MNTFVSRKNLALIPLVSREGSACADVAETFHQRVHFLRASVHGGVLHQPFAKCSVEGLALGTGNQPSLFDEILIGAQGDIFHTRTVYTKNVPSAGDFFP